MATTLAKRREWEILFLKAHKELKEKKQQPGDSHLLIPLVSFPAISYIFQELPSNDL